MICDIEQLDRDRLDADVCVVGAGAAGLTIASELDGTSLRIVVLEAGRAAVDSSTQALYESDVVGLPHGGIHGYRLRALGGSTLAWAGQVLPLFDIDFAARPWIQNSGWPITRDELEPAYRRIAGVLRVPPFPRDAGAWTDALPAPPPFDRSLLDPYFSEFSPEPNFSRLLAPKLMTSQNVTVVLGGVVTRLVSDRSARSIDIISARSLRGRAIEVAPRFTVICGGGVENARLLLVSDIGTENDLVGRYFQDHPGIVVGAVNVRDRNLAATLAPRRIRSIKYAPRLRLAERVQREEQTAHVGAGLVYDLTQPKSLRAGKVLLRAVSSPHLRRAVPEALRDVMRDPVPLARAAYRVVRGGAALDTRVEPLLAVGGEQRPNADSRVLLTDTRDATGTPRVALDWRITLGDLADYRLAAEIAVSELERTGVGTVDLDAARLPTDPEEAAGRLLDSGHHMGTTRMSESAATGVVDPNCKVHGVDNLYVASCSVFPTGGISNPTFTMLALCLRVAETLRTRV